MAHRMVPAHAALLVIVIAIGMSGCGGGGAPAPLTRQDEDLMRKPVGSVPMPPEALRAMQSGNQAAAKQVQPVQQSGVVQ